ncbi:hypothetical protein TNCV_3880751 [Trichonephila clavipes]|nr:hypothetical protein TNCV_3880751 [Trichonephila clavipes]
MKQLCFNRTLSCETIRWSSGSVLRFHATCPGSIPGLGKVDSTFRPYCSGSINEYQTMTSAYAPQRPMLEERAEAIAHFRLTTKHDFLGVYLQWLGLASDKVCMGCGSPMVKVSDNGRHVMSSSPVPLKTRRVGQRCTLYLSRTETSPVGVMW